MESGKITQSEAIDRFQVSKNTLRKARRAGQIEAEQETDGRQAWLYSVEDLQRLYELRGGDPTSDPTTDPVSVQPTDPTTDPVTDTAEAIAFGILRHDHEALRKEHEQQGRELQRSRSDYEEEKGERERLERETIQLRAELDAARTIAGDRASRIEKLEADAAERTEKLDEYAQNLTRRYRRTVRRAEKAAGASGSEQ